jgi:hypothetical protein
VLLLALVFVAVIETLELVLELVLELELLESELELEVVALVLASVTLRYHGTGTAAGADDWDSYGCVADLDGGRGGGDHDRRSLNRGSFLVTYAAIAASTSCGGPTVFHRNERKRDNVSTT